MTRLISFALILIALAACSLPTDEHESAGPQAAPAQAVAEVPPAKTTQAPDVPGFIFLREERLSCGGQTNTVQIYSHEKTGLEFVLIPGGEFKMGSPDGEEGRDYKEGPQRRVRMKPFLLCRTEVTNKAYRQLRPDHDSGALNGVSLNGDTQPVVNVNWEEAKAWCKAIDLRLPVEAEWEYACRAGTTTRFHYGDCKAGLDRYAWYTGNSDESYPVGQKLPNAFGLFDMHGNVWEWVEDIWHDNYQGAPTDGSAWLTGSSGRVYRGGGCGYLPSCCRSAFRTWLDPGNHADDLGFRPASSLP